MFHGGVAIVHVQNIIAAAGLQGPVPCEEANAGHQGPHAEVQGQKGFQKRFVAAIAAVDCRSIVKLEAQCQTPVASAAVFAAESC